MIKNLYGKTINVFMKFDMIKLDVLFHYIQSAKLVIVNTTTNNNILMFSIQVFNYSLRINQYHVH